MPAHSLHQTFDICEEDNLGRVHSLLALGYAEVAGVLSPAIESMPASVIYKELQEMDCLRIHFSKHVTRTSLVLRVKETVREFLISRVLAGWLAVTLPAKAPYWEGRASELLRSLSSYSALLSALRVGPRRLSPF